MKAFIIFLVFFLNSALSQAHIKPQVEYLGPPDQRTKVERYPDRTVFISQFLKQKSTHFRDGSIEGRDFSGKLQYKRDNIGNWIHYNSDGSIMLSKWKNGTIFSSYKNGSPTRITYPSGQVSVKDENGKWKVVKTVAEAKKEKDATVAYKDVAMSVGSIIKKEKDATVAYKDPFGGKNPFLRQVTKAPGQNFLPETVPVSYPPDICIPHVNKYIKKTNEMIKAHNKMADIVNKYEKPGYAPLSTISLYVERSTSPRFLEVQPQLPIRTEPSIITGNK